MYASNGPLLCRSAFKRKLKAISVLVSTPKAALNMFQHGFINPIAFHMVIVHGAGSISTIKSDTTSLLCREWILRVPEINVTLMTSKLAMRSPILQALPHDPHRISSSEQPSDSLPPVSFLKYSSKTEFKHLTKTINKIRNSAFPGSERPLLRRIRDSLLSTARNWGSVAANAAFNEFMKRYEEERACAFTENGSAGVKHHLESLFLSLEGFSSALKQQLEELSQNPQFHRVRVDHFLKHFVAKRESKPLHKFVLLVRSTQSCKTVCSILKKSAELAGLSEDVVELGAKLGTSPKRRTSLMDRAKEGDFVILVTTPAMLRTLKTDFKEPENTQIELVWFDVSPPSEPVSDVFVLASICDAASVAVMLDTSHKRASIVEKQFQDAKTTTAATHETILAVDFQEPPAVLTRANGHARVHPSGSEDLFHRWMSTMPHDQYWEPKVAFAFSTSTLRSDEPKTRPVKQHVCTISSWPALCPFRGEVSSPPAPSKRLARQLACCEALRQLDTFAQFDSSLRPAHQRKLNEHSSDTDYSDFDKKKSRMYSTMVPEIWRTTSPSAAVEPENIWIYSIDIEGVDATPNPTTNAVGFITVGGALPIDQVPPFTIFDHITSKPATGTPRNVSVVLRGSQTATAAQLKQLQQFHSSVFKHLLPGLSAVHDWSWNETDSRNYIIAPLVKLEDAGNWTVNWESAQPWWESSSSLPGIPIDWKAYESREEFERVVKESILVLQTNQQVVVGFDVKWDLSPDSKWPFDVKFTSPMKISSEVTPTSDPPATAAAMADSQSSSTVEATPTKSKRIASNGEFYTFRDHFRDRWGLVLADGPQPIVGVRPFAFRAVNVLIPPAQANNTQQEPVVTPTKVPNDMQFQMFPELCRRLPISAVEFRFFRFLPSIFMRLEGLVKASHLIFDVVALPKPADDESRCSLVAHVLEALTAPSCSEAINFEQLETVGDCFLKFIACLDTFLRNPLLHEFQLEIVKHLFVANKTLYEKSVKWNLGCFLNTRHCKVENWVPSGIRFTNPVSEQSINDKRVADIFEALLGACYRHGGSSEALKFLKCAGFEHMLVDVAAEMPQRLAAAQPLIQPFLRQFDVKELEKKIGYTFKTKEWLLIAFMHPSCKGPILSSQLKFLGDSIIDMYTLDRWMMVETVKKPLSPGDITDLRAAAVMGTSECAFARMLGLHEHVVQQSKNLALHIREYSERSLPASDDGLHFSHFAAADPPDALSAVLEALLGAIYIDSGGNLSDVFAILDATFKPMFLQKYLDLNQPQLALAPVKQLSEMSARRWCTYVQREERQLRLFDSARCAVFVHRKEIAKCFASNKKEARKKGCTATIRFLASASEWWTSVCDCKKPKSALKAAALPASQASQSPPTSPDKSSAATDLPAVARTTSS
eukprot:TRINITY_DN1520_c0_g2_i1.p1 TRINITY_DN1520_c0_g2~~TRINITY_DN1520_c0_g2_i1.p1  ORF type:complete len:1474 (-),score=285.28 TRINITY_DN1520_c0_g2_i1:134-4306(-)